MTSQGDSTPNHRYRGFHKTGYAFASLPPRSQSEGNHRLVRQFHGPGVERQTDHENQGFIYGSTMHYQRDGGMRVTSNKMCAESLVEIWVQVFGVEHMVSSPVRTTVMQFDLQVCWTSEAEETAAGSWWVYSSPLATRIFSEQIEMGVPERALHK